MLYYVLNTDEEYMERKSFDYFHLYQDLKFKVLRKEDGVDSLDLDILDNINTSKDV